MRSGYRKEEGTRLCGKLLIKVKATEEEVLDLVWTKIDLVLNCVE